MQKRNRIFQQHSMANSMFLLGIAFAAFFVSCTKTDDLPNMENASSQEQPAKRNSGSQGQTTESPYKLLSATYENGQMIRLVNYSSVDGSLKTDRSYVYNENGLLTTFIKGEGQINYVKNREGRTIRANFVHDKFRTKNYYILYNRNETNRTFTSDRYNYKSSIVERMIKYFNSDGTIKLIEYYQPTDMGMQLKGSKSFYLSSTFEEIEAWKEVASFFPEPEMPGILEMYLPGKIVMQGDYLSASGDEKIKDQEINIERSAANTNDLRGKVLRITPLFEMSYDLYFHYPDEASEGIQGNALGRAEINFIEVVP